MIRKVGILVAVLFLSLESMDHSFVRAQEAPGERFQTAVVLLEEKRLPEAREAFLSLLLEYDNPENRQTSEYDSLLAGSLYYLGETYFQEDKFEEAAVHYAEVIAGFRTFQPVCYYHLGLSKHYRRDYQGAIATFGDLVSQYPGSVQAPQALYYQGVCYEWLKDKAAAKAAFQTMIERYPQHTWSKKAQEKAIVLEKGR